MAESEIRKMLESRHDDFRKDPLSTVKYVTDNCCIVSPWYPTAAPVCGKEELIKLLTEYKGQVKPVQNFSIDYIGCKDDQAMAYARTSYMAQGSKGASLVILKKTDGGWKVREECRTIFQKLG